MSSPELKVPTITPASSLMMLVVPGDESFFPTLGQNGFFKKFDGFNFAVKELFGTGFTI